MFVRFAKTLILIAVVAVVSFGQAAGVKSGFDAKDYTALIERISSGANSEERGAAIKAELSAIKVRVSTEGFSRKARDGATVRGNNIFGEVSNPRAKRTVMIGAHYDRVAAGKGAVDNASGSAAVLMLLRAFRDNPLKDTNLQAAFWDHEEQGLHGSRIFVENRKDAGLPAVYINFDVYGYGDTLWLWSEGEPSAFVGALLDSSAASKLNAVHGSVYPPSDHLSFKAGGVETYSFSLLSADEVSGIVQLLGGEAPAPGKMPKALTTIHTESDTLDKIDAAAVVRSLPIVEAAIRILDK